MSTNDIIYYVAACGCKVRNGAAYICPKHSQVRGGMRYFRWNEDEPKHRDQGARHEHDKHMPIRLSIWRTRVQRNA